MELNALMSICVCGCRRRWMEEGVKFDGAEGGYVVAAIAR